ncbi:autotransporter-associated beta strand repeat-containing protein [Martelella sp. HB161492]|uniref:autotransporter-associated beta strand repeat-containing protein n=1 Tax=Martelella sp. HB161492 TaxID=2720726 RepID=UPI0015905DDE|nr:autotransporter-associated beta strand repeat-containing protein [Martelella sp. HB161492]
MISIDIKRRGGAETDLRNHPNARRTLSRLLSGTACASALLLGMNGLGNGPARAQDLYWNAGATTSGVLAGGDGTWTTTGAEWTTAPSYLLPNIGWTNGDTAYFSGSGGTVTVDSSAAAITVGGLSVDGTVTYDIIADPGAATNAATTLTFVSGGGGPVGIDVANGAVLNISANLGDGGAGLGFNLTGGGELVLGGHNTLSGDSTVSSGTLQLDSDDALSASTKLTMMDGTIIKFGNANALAAELVIDSGDVTLEGKTPAASSIKLSSGLSGSGNLLVTVGGNGSGPNAGWVDIGPFTLTGDLTLDKNTSTGYGSVVRLNELGGGMSNNVILKNNSVLVINQTGNTVTSFKGVLTDDGSSNSFEIWSDVSFLGTGSGFSGDTHVNPSITLTMGASTLLGGTASVQGMLAMGSSSAFAGSVTIASSGTVMGDPGNSVADLGTAAGSELHLQAGGSLGIKAGATGNATAPLRSVGLTIESGAAITLDSGATTLDEGLTYKLLHYTGALTGDENDFTVFTLTNAVYGVTARAQIDNAAQVVEAVTYSVLDKQYWNATGSGALAGGDGTWSTGISAWSADETGVGALASWSNSNGYAYFEGTTAGTVTLDSAAAVALTGASFSLGYTIADDGTGNSTLSLETAPNGPAAIQGTTPFDVAAGTTATIGAILANGTTSTSISKTGQGTLALSATNTFSGSINIVEGTLSIAAEANLGSIVGYAERHINLIGGTLEATTQLTLESTDFELFITDGMLAGDDLTGGLTVKAALNSGTTATAMLSTSGYVILAAPQTLNFTPFDFTVVSGTLQLGDGNYATTIYGADYTVQSGARLLSVNATNSNHATELNGKLVSTDSTATFEVTSNPIIYQADGSTFTGQTKIHSGGTLNVSGGSLAGSVLVDSQGTLEGSVAYGTVSVGADMTFNSGATLYVTLNTSANAAAIFATGALTLNGGVIKVASGGNALTAGQYTLIQYSGALTGDASSLSIDSSIVLGAGLHATIAENAATGEIYLNVLTAVAQQYWNGAAGGTGAIVGGSGIWDRTTSDWSPDSSGNTLEPWANAGTVAIFSQNAGTVTVDSTSGPVSFAGMTFRDHDYAIVASGANDALSLAGSTVVFDVAAGLTAVVDVPLKGATASISKTGDGKLQLGGTNTFKGVTISAGTLAISSDDNLGDTSGSVTLDGGTLSVVASQTVVTARDIKLTASNGTLNADSGATLEIDGTISDAVTATPGSLTVTGAGVVKVTSNTSSYTGTTTIDGGGTLRLAASGSNASLPGSITINTGTLAIDQLATGFTMTFALTGGADANLSIEGGRTYISQDYSSFTGTTTVSGHLLLLNPGAKLGGSVTVAGDLAGPASGVAYLTGSVTIQSGGEISSSNPATINVADTLTLQAGSYINVNIPAANDPAQIATDTLVLQGSTLYVNPNGLAAGTYHLISYTDGKLTGGSSDISTSQIHVANGLTPSIVVNAGYIDLVVAASPTVATLYWNANGTVSGGTGGGGSDLWTASATTQDWADSAATPYAWSSNDIAIFDGTAGTVSVDSTAGDVEVAGMHFRVDGYIIADNGNAGNVLTLEPTGGGSSQIEVVNAGQTATIDVQLSGATGLSKIGAGKLVLGSTANDYTGGTFVTAGIVSVSGDGNLGAAATAVTLDGGTLEATNTITIARPLHLGAGSGTIDVDPTFTLTLSDLVDDAVAHTAGALVKVDGGTLVLANASNSYSGGTTVSGGTVSVGADTSLGETSGGITLDGGALAASASFSTGRDFTFGAGGATIEVTAAISTLTATGNWSGAGPLTKTGSGVLYLSGTGFSYGGATTVSAGILQLAGTVTASDITVANGAILASSGTNATINSTVTIADGGQLNADSTAVLDIDTLVLTAGAPGSTLNLDVATANAASLLTVNNLTLYGTVKVSPASSLAAGQYNLISYTTLDNGSYLSLNLLAIPTLDSGLSASLGQSGNQIYLDVIRVATTLYWNGTTETGTIINGGSGTWETGGGSNWMDSAANTPAAWVDGDVAIFSVSPTAMATVSVSGTVVVSGLEFDVDGYTLTGMSGDKLTLLSLGTTGSVQFNNNFLSANATTIDVQLDGNSDIAFTGSSDFVLGNAGNSFVGDVTVSGLVTLHISADGNLGATGNSVTLDGTGLLFDGLTSFTHDIRLTASGGELGTEIATADVTVSSMITGSGSLTVDSAGGAIALSGDNSYGGGTLLKEGTLAISDDTNLGDPSGGITIYQSGNTVLHITGAVTSARGVTLAGADAIIEVDANQTFALSGMVSEISATGSLTKTGGGIFVLSNTGNSYSGGTTIEDGQLSIASDGVLGANNGSVTLAGGALAVTGTVSSARSFAVNATGSQIALVSASDKLTLSGTITGSNDLDLTGAGTLQITADNSASYTGKISVAAGLLRFGDGTNDGDVGGAIDVSGSATVNFNNKAALTFAQTISGDGQLTKSNTGTLILSAANSYSGTLSINAGDFQLSGNWAGDVNVNNGASFISKTSGGIASGTITIADGATLAADHSAVLTVDTLVLTPGTTGSVFSANVSGPAAAAVVVASTVTLEGEVVVKTGPTGTGTLGAGSYNLLTYTTLAAGSYDMMTYGTINHSAALTPTLAVTTSGSTSTLVLELAVSTTLLTWNGSTVTGTAIDGGTGTWSNDAAKTNWMATSPTNTAVAWSNGETAVFSATPGGDPAPTVSIDNSSGAVTAAGLQFAIGGYTLKGSTPSDTLTLVGASGFVAEVTDTSFTATLDVVLDGTSNFKKTGPGRLVLSGSNLFTGTVSIAAGTLSVSADDNFGNLANAINLGAATLDITSSFMSARNIKLADASATISIANSSDTLTANGVFSGSGDLNLTGAGRLVLTNNANSYTGDTIVSGGAVLAIADDAVLGATAHLTLDNATLEVNSAGAISRDTTLGAGNGKIETALSGGTITLNGAIHGSGALTLESTGLTFMLTNTNTYTGGTIVNAGTVVSIAQDENLGNASGALSLYDQATLVTTGSFNATRAIILGGTDATISVAASTSVLLGGTISGSSLLHKTGDGTLTLSSASNSYAGGTRIEGGILAVGADASLGAPSGKVSLSGGVLQTTASFSSSRDVDIDSTGGSISVNTGTTLALAGLLTDSTATAGVLTKSGDGTLLISGSSNTFSGATTIAAGMLKLSGTLAGDISVRSGATLQNGTTGGSAGGTVSVADGGTLSASYAAPMTFGNLVLSARTGSTPGSTYIAELNTTSDPAPVTTTDLSLYGTIEPTSMQTLDAGNYKLIAYTNLTAGALSDVLLASLAPLASGTVAQLSLVGSDLVLQVVTSTDMLYWNGTQTAGTGIVGGDGVWTGDARTNWTDSAGASNLAWSDGATAIFSTMPSTTPSPVITVDSTYAILVGGFKFAVDGYAVTGNTSSDKLTLSAPAGSSFVTVEVTQATDTATLDITLSGTSGLAKSGAGTLVLSAANSYSGGTQISAGTLSISSDSNLGASAGGISISSATLQISGTFATTRGVTLGTLGGTIAVVGDTDTVTMKGQIAGSGALTKTGLGTLVVTADNSYSGGTTVSSGTLQIGDGSTAGSVSGAIVLESDGTLSLMRSDSFDFDNGLSGTGRLAQAGSGTTRMTADNTGFSGTSRVLAGSLEIAANAALGGNIYAVGGLLQGYGILGNVGVLSGGSITAGTTSDMATLSMASLSFSDGASYVVNLDSSGSSDLLSASGAVTISGGSVVMSATGSTFTNGQQFTIISTTDAVTTEDGNNDGNAGFDAVTSDLAYLQATLDYTATSVILTLNLQEDTGFDLPGMSPNNRATARGIYSLGEDNPLYQIVQSLPADEVDDALAQLSGDTYTSIGNAMIANSYYVRDAISKRVRNAFGGITTGEDATTVSNYAAAPEVAAPFSQFGEENSGIAVWLDGYGSWSDMKGSNGAASMTSSVGGFFIGSDFAAFDRMRFGALAGYGSANFSVDDRNASGGSDDFTLGAYGGGEWGAIGVDFGMAYTWHDVSAKRHVSFTGLSEDLAGSYRAGTFQIYGDVGYSIAISDAYRIEPFVNAAYVYQQTDGFTETGGIAALSHRGTDDQTGFTTLGIRTAHAVALGAKAVELTGELGWRHAYGDINAAKEVYFSGGDVFSIYGTPLAKDQAVVSLGIASELKDNLSIGLNYTGLFGGGYQSQNVGAKLNLRF